eukprot:CAMPEP_0201597056 /NCGR_PEP_ID=MMETSP0190_2-20130828/193629_1 /ASSEMBLY_ACC=CAM_ASM_000263 /TAXON_ID=37353 /ORGANISM="Rosalina sp." /LENGTH=324 /DNA_ID=CAMNT_0048057801 /DNA_START=63 /DNA_END=1037 /DNA_ORIENTATION=-
MKTDMSAGEMLVTTPMGSTFGSHLDTLETPNVDHSIDTNITPNDDDRDMSRISMYSHASHNTQLSMNIETPNDRGFNLFGWFNSNGSKNPNRASNIVNNNFRQRSDDSDNVTSANKKKVRPKSINVNMDRSHPRNPRKVISISEYGSDDEEEHIPNNQNSRGKRKSKTKKKSSKKKWRNLVKRHHQDSLDIPSHQIPLDELQVSNSNQSQLTSVRLDGGNDGSKMRQKKMTMDPHSNNKFENGDIYRQTSKSVTRRGRGRNNSKVRQMAAKFDRDGGFASDDEFAPSTTKLKTKSSKSKRKKLKSRLKKKKQTKQWISNVHQVF